MPNRCGIITLIALLVIPSTDEAALFDIFGRDSLANGKRFAFVPSLTDPAIVAVDTAKNAVAASLEIPHVSGPIVVSDKLDLLIATDPDNEMVTVINLEAKETVKQLHIGMRPDAALLNPYDRYVAFGSRDGSVSVWDMQTFSEMLRVDGLASAQNITFGFDGRNLYVVESRQKRISVIEMYERRKVAEIDLGGPDQADAEVSAISRSADGYTGFVSVTSENRVIVIDLVDWQVKHSIPVGGAPVRPYSPADHRYVLIPHRDSKALTVLSALSYEVIATIPTGIEARELNTGWLDTAAFVMPEVGNTIAVIDLDALRLADTIELPGHPDDGLVTSDSRTLFTALLETGSIASIDARSRSLSAVIRTSSDNLRGIEIAVSNNICH